MSLVRVEPGCDSGVSGDDRDRTDNLLRARQALSQLSYVPIEGCEFPEGIRYPVQTIAVGVPRFELGTSSLSAMRSNQLSYTPGVPQPFDPS